MTDRSSDPFSRLDRVFRNEHDSALARLAVRRGIISPAQFEEASRAGGSLLDFMTSRGWIESRAIEPLRAELGKEEFARASLLPGEEIPPEAQTATSDPERQVGDFILVSSLGQGGAGEVWKAWDRALRRWVALKHPSAPLPSRVLLERFQREASVVAKLVHPNIVPIHRIGEHRGRPYIVFQLVDGQTLDQIRPPLREAVESIRVAALAVDFAHHQGVVHRDLKPGNLMRDTQGHLWILDFGLAWLSEGEDR